MTRSPGALILPLRENASPIIENEPTVTADIPATELHGLRDLTAELGPSTQLAQLLVLFVMHAGDKVPAVLASLRDGPSFNSASHRERSRILAEKLEREYATSPFVRRGGL